MTENLNYIAFDFETATYNKNSACSIDLVAFENGKEIDSVYSLIHPAKMYFIPEWTRDIHGISYDDVRNKPYFPEVWQNLVIPFLEKYKDFPLVAHNGDSFDKYVVKACCDYFEMEYPDYEFIDSLKIARKTWTDFDNHRLTSLGEKFGIVYKAHDALEDSRTCGMVIAEAAKVWGVNSVRELLEKCNLSFSKLSNLDSRFQEAVV